MCTAATYKTKDFYFGRTLDYEISYGDQVVITPRNYPFRLRNGETLKSGRHTLKSKTATKRLPEEYTELRNRLSERFSTKVQMTCSQQGKGKISIPFASEEELERIITLLDKI